MDNELVNKFLDAAKLCDREGMTDLISYLGDELGFFDAPASTQYHGAYEGALLEHSLNVCDLAKKLGFAWLGATGYKKMESSIVICALLHDIGKCGDFGKQNYIPNKLKDGKVSTTKPFASNPDLLYIDHEIRSIKIAAMFIDLTEEEEHAILYHNGLYGSLKYAIQGKETPLYMIIHFADMWASRVVESKTKGVKK